ncbi:VPLPA-CTERM sorting domain-containing protein [Pseudooceanicola onchidii]|uniref:VPLPA-CTERM sorting domain-containing protein n=1 Tax=Pseudooceanicola onchidii TaxID=2562279 RepID=UPI0010AB0134|nr:VPLPA-CTERM sorting domain-containing protein [Pseudooceanicola onchidii]
MKTALYSAAVLATSAWAAVAAPLNLPTQPEPTIDFFVDATASVFGGYADLWFDTVALGSVVGAGPVLEVGVDVQLGFDVSDPYGTLTGALFTTDGADGFLDGDLVNVGFDTYVVELVFGNLTGSAASLFGDFALVELFFEDPYLNDPLAMLEDGETYAVYGVVSSVAPVPLPAGLPLMAGGFALLIGLRARRKTS